MCKTLSLKVKLIIMNYIVFFLFDSVMFTYMPYNLQIRFYFKVSNYKLKFNYYFYFTVNYPFREIWATLPKAMPIAVQEQHYPALQVHAGSFPGCVIH